MFDEKRASPIHRWDPDGWSLAMIIPRGVELEPGYTAFWRECLDCSGREWRQVIAGLQPGGGSALQGHWIQPRGTARCGSEPLAFPGAPKRRVSALPAMAATG